MKIIKALSSLTLAISLISCGGSDSGSDNDSDNDTNDITKAYFVDSGVKGLDYSSASYTGTTDANGGFSYKAGETTTFSFQGMSIGSIDTPANSALFTPLDIFDTTDVNDQRVINLLVFLQSLDNDQNPDNGIELPESSDIAGIDVLDLTSNNFQTNLLALAEVNSLVSETDAIDHLNETLVSASATASLVGRWIYRDAENGDVGATYTFVDDQTLALTEFEDCANNSTYWSASEASAIRNCEVENLDLTWSLSGNVLSMTGDEISDSCTIISSSVNFIEANCVFTGSGLGTELVRFERDTTELNNDLILENYREVSSGSTSFTNLVFDSGLTGSFAYHNSSGVAQSGDEDQGTFTWNTTATTIDQDITDNVPTNFNGSYTLQSQVRGALAALFAGGGDSSIVTLIPDFNSNLANDLVNQVVFGVYDAITGECKSIYMFNNLNAVMPLRKEASVGANDDICDFSGDVIVPESSDSDVYSVTVTNGGFVIEKDNTVEICWPIAQDSLSNHVGFSYLACSTDSSNEFNFEIWRGL